MHELARLQLHPRRSAITATEQDSRRRRPVPGGERIGGLLGVEYYEGLSSFSYLIDKLYEVFRYGHTAPLAAFRRYLVTREDSQPRTMRAHGIMSSP